MVSPLDSPGIWVAALLTLATYSFLWRDNAAYKLAEHIFIGVSTGYLVVVTLGDALYREVWRPLFLQEDRQYLLIIPTILGILLVTRLIPKWSSYSRVSIAFFIGVTAGVNIPNNVQTYLIKQTGATLSPLYHPSATWGEMVNSWVILLGVLSVLIYFFYSVKHEGVVKHISRVGVVYLMLFFGASFGYTVMGRISLLIGRMRFLLIDWLGLGG